MSLHVKALAQAQARGEFRATTHVSCLLTLVSIPGPSGCHRCALAREVRSPPSRGRAGPRSAYSWASSHASSSHFGWRRRQLCQRLSLISVSLTPLPVKPYTCHEPRGPTLRACHSVLGSTYPHTCANTRPLTSLQCRRHRHAHVACSSAKLIQASRVELRSPVGSGIGSALPSTFAPSVRYVSSSFPSK